MRHVCLGLALLTALAVPAGAQDRLFFGGYEVGAVGHFFEVLGRAPDWIHAPRFGGDRYVHVSATEVLDVVTGRRLPLDENWIVAYDRARPRVFAAREGGVWSVDVRNGWAVLVLPRLEGLNGCVHATSADVLVCAFARGDGQHDLLRASLFGPVQVGTVRFGYSYGPPGWLATPDGSALYMVDCRTVSPIVPSYCIEQGVARLDLATGTVARSSHPNLQSSFPLIWDEARDRLFTISSTAISVFSSDLAFIGSASPPARCVALAISSHTDTVYLSAHDYYYGQSSTSLQAFDAWSYTPLRQAAGRADRGGCDLAVFTAPGKPRDLRAVIAGRRVALQWTNVGAASHFVLEAGTAPGRADLSFFIGADPQVQFSDVPPGTYYVRVRGGNVHGGGRPSDELVVTVR